MHKPIENDGVNYAGYIQICYISYDPYYLGLGVNEVRSDRPRLPPQDAIPVAKDFFVVK